MELIDIMNRRFSVRKFDGRKPEQEKLNAVLLAGNMAPTAKNQQPQRIYVLQGDEALAKLDTLTHCRYGAGTVLLFTYNTKEDWQNPKEEGVHSGVEDVSIVATHMMLRAAELDLDTCWCNFFWNTELDKAFGLPDYERSVLIMPIGYAAEDAEPAPMHRNKKRLDDIVKYL